MLRSRGRLERRDSRGSTGENTRRAKAVARNTCLLVATKARARVRRFCSARRATSKSRRRCIDGGREDSVRPQRSPLRPRRGGRPTPGRTPGAARTVFSVLLLRPDTAMGGRAAGGHQGGAVEENQTISDGYGGGAGSRRRGWRSPRVRDLIAFWDLRDRRLRSASVYVAPGTKKSGRSLTQLGARRRPRR
jgi:hypothetical protein